MTTSPLTILDGAMGTELQRRGINTGLPLWSATALIESPQTVQAIHEDYIRAGATVITTNTFRTNPRTFRRGGLEDLSRELTVKACELAKAATRVTTNEVRVAGSLASLEDCYRPDLTPPDSELYPEHEIMAQLLKEGGVDYILAETHNSLREIRAVLEAIRKVKMPFAISFVCNAAGDLLSGEKIEDAVALALTYKPLFLGTNCARLNIIESSLKRILASSKGTPVSIYANGDGEPDDAEGWKFSLSIGVPNYAESAKNWRALGASIIGGCCGTTPEYIEGLKRSGIR